MLFYSSSVAFLHSLYTTINNYTHCKTVKVSLERHYFLLVLCHFSIEHKYKNVASHRQLPATWFYLRILKHFAVSSPHIHSKQKKLPHYYILKQIKPQKKATYSQGRTEETSMSPGDLIPKLLP